MEFFWIVLIVLLGFFAFVWRKSKQYQWTDWGNGYFNFIDGLNRWFGMEFHRLTIDHIPLIHDPKEYTHADGSTQGAVWICNHVSGVDPFLMVAASKRPVRFLIAREQFERKEMHWLLKRIKFIPVDRAGIAKKSNSRSVLSEATKALANGEVICIYPQGGIVSEGSNGSLDRLKKGAFHLAQESQVPLIVSSITGVGGFGKEAGALFQRSHAKINYHQSIVIDESVELDDVIAKTTAIFVEAHQSHLIKDNSSDTQNQS